MAPSRPRTRRPRPLPGRVLPVLTIVLAGLVLLSSSAASPPSSPDERPIHFDSETVRLYVLGDSLEVRGLYHFDCGGATAAPVSMAYPYPVDSLLGSVRALTFECRPVGGDWRPLEHVDVPRKMVSFWSLPPCSGDGLEVKAVYRQALLAQYARYTVTTALGWGRPLRSAVFEIHLPDGATPVEFSLPFEAVDSEEGLFYRYEATDFTPDRDITVTWKEE
jgi:hypothetical protein